MGVIDGTKSDRREVHAQAAERELTTGFFVVR